MKQISRFLLNFFSPVTSSCFRRRNPLTGKGRRVDAPRRVRSPQSRRSCKGATNFLPLKTFTQLELNSSKLLQLRKSLSLINVRAWFTCFVSCVCNATLFRCRGTGFLFLAGKPEKRERKKKDKKKKLPRNRLSFTHAQTKPPRVPNFVYTLTRKRMTAIVFEEIFRIGFQLASRSKLFCVHRVKLVFPFPRPFFPCIYPNTFSLTPSLRHTMEFYRYTMGIELVFVPLLIRNIEFSRPSEKRHFLFHYFRGHTTG